MRTAVDALCGFLCACEALRGRERHCCYGCPNGRSQTNLNTSWLARAEILATLGRKRRNRELTEDLFREALQQFAQDWLYTLETLALNTETMASVSQLVTDHPLQASDAVHLSTALWLQDTAKRTPELAAEEVHLEFVVADRQLEHAAVECGLRVFNPEKKN